MRSDGPEAGVLFSGPSAFKTFFFAVIPAKAGIQGPWGKVLAACAWTPAFAGVTEGRGDAQSWMTMFSSEL